MYILYTKFKIWICTLSIYEVKSFEREEIKYFESIEQVSISSTFYARVFRMNVLSLVHFGFVFFCQKDIGEKSARKMLMKLTTLVIWGRGSQPGVREKFLYLWLG